MGIEYRVSGTEYRVKSNTLKVAGNKKVIYYLLLMATYLTPIPNTRY